MGAIHTRAAAEAETAAARVRVVTRTVKERMAKESGSSDLSTRASGLGGVQGEADGLRPAHLADDDDVGVLAERIEQTLLEAGRVDPHLSLSDERPS